MKSVTRIILILLIPAILLLAGWYWTGITETQTKNPAASQASSTPANNALGVHAMIAVERPFTNKIYTSGSVIANDQVLLQSEISGRITEILFKEGQPVSKGDLLVKINDADLRAQRRRAELNRELAAIREQRQRSLLENKAIAQEDYDIALNQLNTVRAEIEIIQANIDKTEIRAPFDGVIGLRRVSQGSLIAPGTPIASLQNLDVVKIDFSVPERYAGSVQIGDRITFTRQGLDEEGTATVAAIEPRVDANTRTISIRALARNTDTQLLPGAFTQIAYELSTVGDAIMIPAEAIIPELGGNSLFLYKNGTATRVRIETGIRTERLVQVNRGVQQGDTVLVTGILQLREGLPVRITSINTPEP